MPRARLDRATVVQAAAALADREGLENTSIARVAEKLGVRSPSVYNHVDGLPALRRDLALLGLRTLAQRLTHATAGLLRGEAVAALAETYRAFALERPGLYAATLRPAPKKDRELHQSRQKVIALVLAALKSYGLDGDEALHAARGLRALVHGFVSLEALGGFGVPVELDDSFRRLVRAYSDGLEPPPAAKIPE